LDQWWGAMLGPGKVFDTSKYMVVCANVLGSCYGSTGPESTDPNTGEFSVLVVIFKNRKFKCIIIFNIIIIIIIINMIITTIITIFIIIITIIIILIITIT
jgi:hypothetical protein